MKEPTRPGNDCDRREMLRKAARCAALAGISGLSALLFARGAANREATRCRRDLPCRACGELVECTFPQAAEARRLEPEVRRHG
jgi:hypothetical protein